MARESQEQRKKRTARILALLRKRYPDARTALHFRNPLELLVATILSAQCTDKRVNGVTADLFREYRSAKDYAQADPLRFEQQVRSTGFYHNKTRSILGAARKIVEDFAGKVPDTMEGLLELPGVARKTANVVLGSAFGRNEGIAVDTHVIRLAGRLGLTLHPDNRGDRIEKDLMELVPRKEWTLFAHLVIHHGRETCIARKPLCGQCPVRAHCPSAFRFD